MSAARASQCVEAASVLHGALTVSILSVVPVVAKHPPVHHIPELPVHPNGQHVLFSNKKVHEEPVVAALEVHCGSPPAARPTTHSSVVASSPFISSLARPNLLYSGATVRAVTWPCQLRPLPSALPSTARHHRYTAPREQPAPRTIRRDHSRERFVDNAVLGPFRQVLEVECRMVLRAERLSASLPLAALEPHRLCERVKVRKVELEEVCAAEAADRSHVHEWTLQSPAQANMHLARARRVLAQRAWARHAHVFVGISGGVDSSVAAARLKAEGHRVTGVFMRNWDPADEFAAEVCPQSDDYRSAQQVARQLGIELVHRGFEPEYWASVFEPLLTAYSEGRTPNPDVACNRHVKFGAFFEWCKRQGADAVATGHYACVLGAGAHEPGRVSFGGDMSSARMRGGGDRVVWSGGGFGKDVLLAHAVDRSKDQSFFLCQIPRSVLSQTMFPIGGFTKGEVRALAAELGLSTAERKDSTGICFIGRRAIREFLPQYMKPTPGSFFSVHTGEALGGHSGAEFWTVGQAARIGGLRQRHYVVHRDIPSGAVWVVNDWFHPLLFSTALCVGGGTGERFSGVDMGLLRDWQDVGTRRPGEIAVEMLNVDPRDVAPSAWDYHLMAKYRKPEFEGDPFEWLIPSDWEGFERLARGEGVRVCCKLNNRMPAAAATLWLVNHRGRGRLALELDLPHRAVSPGQVVAVYSDHEMPLSDGTTRVCLGGGVIEEAGPTLSELGVQSVGPSLEELTARGAMQPQLGCVDGGMWVPWEVNAATGSSIGWTA
jgi:tRNA U34 2-thiouridine synthase MnmA/TrmU